MLGKIAVVFDGVESWRIEFGKTWVCVLTMETFLISIDPTDILARFFNIWKGWLHCLPVKSAFIGNASPMWKFREVYSVY